MNFGRIRRCLGTSEPAVDALPPDDVHVAPVVPLQQLRQVGLGAVEGMRTEEAAQVRVGGVEAVVLRPRQSSQLVVRHAVLGQELNRLLVVGEVVK